MLLYINTENMSMKKWRQWAEEKSKLDEQTEEIHQKFKMDKIKKEFGQLSGEELFKPITKRLDDEKSTTVEEEEEEEQEEEQEGPDYAIDEFDDINPFGDEFRPDASTPEPPPTPPPPPPSPTPSTTSYLDVDDDFPQPPPPLMEEKNPHVKSGRSRNRLSLNINTNQSCCKQSIN